MKRRDFLRSGAIGAAGAATVSAMPMPTPSSETGTGPTAEVSDDATIEVRGAGGARLRLSALNHTVSFEDERGHRWSASGPAERVGAVNTPVAAVFVGDGIAVLERGNARVQVFARDGRTIRVFGGYGSEPGMLAYPSDIATATDGTIVVADTHNHRVQWFTQDGTLARHSGELGSAPGQFNAPRSLLALDDGSLWVLDAGNLRVQCLDPEGRVSGVFGADQPWTHPRALSRTARGNILVLDSGSAHVYAFSPEGQCLDRIALRDTTGAPIQAGRLDMVDATFNLQLV